MKKITLIYSSLVFIWLINGCTNDTAKTEITKEEPVKTEVVTKMPMPVKEEKVIKTEQVKEEKVVKAEQVKKEEVVKVVAKSGKELYAKCSSCHGPQGKLKALGKSNIIAGQKSEILFQYLIEYKKGTRNISGMGALMKSQLITYSKSDLKILSEYISSLK